VVLPDAPLGEVVLEPLLAGAVVLPDVLLWPEVLLPEVAPLAASCMHFSFSAPMRCAHFVSLAPAAALPLAPVLVEVLDWPLVLPLVEDEGVVCELVLPEALELEGVVVWELVLPLAVGDGVVCELVLPLAEDDGVVWELVLPLVDGVVWELVLPLAAPRSRRQRSFSAAIMLSQLLLAMPPAAALPDAPLVCAPVLPDEVWAKDALDSARSAAAVAQARTFKFIWMLLLRNGLVGIAARDTQAPCRSSRRAWADRSTAA
jgi:hypothetical protein